MENPKSKFGSRNPSSRNRVRIGCDVGGTFTDIVLQEEAGDLHVRKFSSTPSDPSRAIVHGIKSLINDLGLEPNQISEIVHGTTIASNVILEKKGALTGLITTDGFRDILEIGRIRTPTMFDLKWNKPLPLVQRRYRRGIKERIASDGSVVEPLSIESLRDTLSFFVREGVASIAVCFINSYKNPVHELAVKKYIEVEFPIFNVTASCDVLPEMKEYERLSTTVVNAYILPAMRSYLAKLQNDLADIGVGCPVQVVASNGGMMGVVAAAERPVYAVASGPAGGIIGAAKIASLIKRPDAIAFDMGGTTAKAAVIESGVPSVTNEYEFRDGISAPSRFVKGGGYVLKVPALDIAEVGAGGGSIASIDDGGLLQIGPESAGSLPGPACYELGNDRPTVTDANLVLGLLNPNSLAGGSLKLNFDAAVQAIQNSIGRPLGLSLLDAAHGMRHLANISMARAIRAVTVERGRDPRDMTLIAFGGGGPVHAVDVAKILGIKKVVIPAMAGVFASAGMLVADLEYDLVRAVNKRIDIVTTKELFHLFTSMEEEILVVLAADGYTTDNVEFRLKADLRFLGQSSELQVLFTLQELGPDLIPSLTANFLSLYERSFGYVTAEPIEFVNLRVTGVGQKDNRLNLERNKLNQEAREKSLESLRDVSFNRDSPLQATKILKRFEVGSDLITGPVIIESYDTTVVVPYFSAIYSDNFGNLIMEIDNAEK